MPWYCYLRLLLFQLTTSPPPSVYGFAVGILGGGRSITKSTTAATVSIANARSFQRLVTTTTTTTAAAAAAAMEYQSDATQFGRGDHHLSALLEEGDVVVYQAGYWKVDGVTVGDIGDDDTELPTFRYAKIETIQIVWTHNCEHGVLRGLPLEWKPAKEDQEEGVLGRLGGDDDSNNNNNNTEDDHPLVEFGPEQLIARIPVEWNEEKEWGVVLVPSWEENVWTPME